MNPSGGYEGEFLRDPNLSEAWSCLGAGSIPLEFRLRGMYTGPLAGTAVHGV